MDTKIAVFRGKKIRKTLHNNAWWFVIVDVMSVLTDSVDPSGYIKLILNSCRKQN
jgi:prophage antirepressor-like protein